MNYPKCLVTTKTHQYEARFIGVFQYSDVIEPSALRGGHGGGVIAYPIAVVETDGELVPVRLHQVQLESELKGDKQ